MPPIQTVRCSKVYTEMTVSQITDGGRETIANIELESDEEVLHDLRPSVISWPLVIAFGWLIFPVVYSWWRHRRTRYIVTTDRVIIKRDRPVVKTIELPYRNISRVQTTKRRIEYFSKFGTIQLDTISEGKVALKAVPDHTEVANTIREQKESTG